MRSLNCNEVISQIYKKVNSFSNLKIDLESGILKSMTGLYDAIERKSTAITII